MLSVKPSNESAAVMKMGCMSCAWECPQPIPPPLQHPSPCPAATKLHKQDVNKLQSFGWSMIRVRVRLLEKGDGLGRVSLNIHTQDRLQAEPEVAKLHSRQQY